MRTLERVGIATVGYEGRTADELVDLIRDEGVTIVVDVRLTPLSRKPGLSKNRLADALHEAGIEYLHLPALGNPRDNRYAYRRSDERAHTHFRSLMRGPDASAALDDLAEQADRGSVALLCFERNAGSCHRSLVIEALLQRNPGLVVHHL